jgi:hypothetical protein
MYNLTIKTTGDEFWDRIAGLVGTESGEVTGSPFTDGKQFYNAVFPNYGEITWIPEHVCNIIEINNNDNQ